MKAQTSMDNLDQYGYNTTQKARPTDPQYAMGAVPGECIPAKWWNWFFNLSVKTLMADRADTSIIIAEINNVLTEAGITPDPSATNQFAAALINIKNTVGVANGLAPGYVKSSSANGEVSVNPTTGVMTGNGVGDINTITLPPNVEADVISVMNYFIVQIFGYGPVLPVAPNYISDDTDSISLDATGENSAILEAYCGRTIKDTDSNYSGRLYSYTGSFTLEGGHWYKIIMSGAGGGGGGGGAGTGSRTITTVQSTTTYTSSLNKGKNGAKGSPGALSIFSIYLAEDTECFFSVGKGGTGGQGATVAYIGGNTNTAATPQKGVAGDIGGNAHIANVLHTKSTSDGDNGTASKCTVSTTSGGQSGGKTENVSGGKGASGGNGSGTVLVIGNRMYSVSGGRGGKGSYNTGAVIDNYNNAPDQYINKYAYNATLPAALAAIQKAPDIYDTSGGLGAWVPVGSNSFTVDDTHINTYIINDAFPGQPVHWVTITEPETLVLNIYDKDFTAFNVFLEFETDAVYGKGGEGSQASWSSTSGQSKYNSFATSCVSGSNGVNGYDGFIVILNDNATFH